jgi:hypothetical protein
LNGSALIGQDIEMVKSMLKYGLDTVYEELEWTDKTSILDIASRINEEFLEKAQQKIAVDLLTIEY